MSGRISDERLREMASPTWRFVGDEYRDACYQLVEERAENKQLRKQVRALEELIEIARKRGHNVDYWLMEACVALAGTVPRTCPRPCEYCGPTCDEGVEHNARVDVGETT